MSLFEGKIPSNLSKKNGETKAPAQYYPFFPSSSSEAFSSEDTAEGSLLHEGLQRMQTGCLVAPWCLCQPGSLEANWELGAVAGKLGALSPWDCSF